MPWTRGYCVLHILGIIFSLPLCGMDSSLKTLNLIACSCYMHWAILEQKSHSLLVLKNWHLYFFIFSWLCMMCRKVSHECLAGHCLFAHLVSLDFWWTFSVHKTHLHFLISAILECVVWLLYRPEESCPSEWKSLFQCFLTRVLWDIVKWVNE